MIRMLNPIIRGWAQYHNHAISSAVFSKLDNIIFIMLVSWAKKVRHPNKSKTWVMAKYWHKVGNCKYVFSTDTQTLEKFSNSKIIRQRLAKLDKSDIDRDYFERLESHGIL